MRWWILFLGLLFTFLGNGWEMFKPGNFLYSPDDAVMKDDRGTIDERDDYYTWFGIPTGDNLVSDRGTEAKTDDIFMWWHVWRTSKLLELLLLNLFIAIIVFSKRVYKFRFGLALMATCQMLVVSNNLAQQLLLKSNELFGSLEIILAALYLLAVIFTVTIDKLPISAGLTQRLADYNTAPLTVLGFGSRGKRQIDEIKRTLQKLEESLQAQQDAAQATQEHNANVDLIIAQSENDFLQQGKVAMQKRKEWDLQLHERQKNYFTAIQVGLQLYQASGNQAAIERAVAALDKAVELNDTMISEQERTD